MLFSVITQNDVTGLANVVQTVANVVVLPLVHVLFKMHGKLERIQGEVALILSDLQSIKGKKQ